jgi:hypothetical protein
MTNAGRWMTLMICYPEGANSSKVNIQDAGFLRY